MKGVFTWFNVNVDISVPAREFPIKPRNPRMVMNAEKPSDIADAIAYAMENKKGFEFSCSRKLSEWLMSRFNEGVKWLGGQAGIMANHLSRWTTAYVGSPYIGRIVKGLFQRPSRIRVVSNGIHSLKDFEGREKANFIFMFDVGDRFDGFVARESSRVIASTTPHEFPPVFEGYDMPMNFFSGLHHFSGRDWRRFDSFLEGFNGWKHLELTTIHGKKVSAARKRLDMFDSIGMDDEEMEIIFGAKTYDDYVDAMLSMENEIYLHADGYYVCSANKRPVSLKKAMIKAGIEAVKYSGGKVGEMDRKGVEIVKKHGTMKKYGDRWIITVPYPKAVKPRHMAGMGDIISSTIAYFGRLVG